MQGKCVSYFKCMVASRYKNRGGGGGQVVFEGAVNEWSHLHQRVHVGKEEL